MNETLPARRCPDHGGSRLTRVRGCHSRGGISVRRGGGDPDAGGCWCPRRSAGGAYLDHSRLYQAFVVSQA